ncbi:hypothetical protein BU16DRAFT_361151 [Lophium mytilinum]|uniref:Uncharacterized protein n=1 Tax=Lophium mytilinum TaxID=390894 RepID=A0A6A6QTV3_9PEZI|nr:hypothetical protein BU16DRAFT_361151 [Lophium mytilinum]
MPGLMSWTLVLKTAARICTAQGLTSLWLTATVLLTAPSHTKILIFLFSRQDCKVVCLMLFHFRLHAFVIDKELFVWQVVWTRKRYPETLKSILRKTIVKQRWRVHNASETPNTSGGLFQTGPSQPEKQASVLHRFHVNQALEMHYKNVQEGINSVQWPSSATDALV